MLSHCCHSHLASVCYRFSIPITLRVNTSCVTFSAVEHQPSLQSPSPQRSRSLYQPRHSICHSARESRHSLELKRAVPISPSGRRLQCPRRSAAGRFSSRAHASVHSHMNMRSMLCSDSDPFLRSRHTVSSCFCSLLLAPAPLPHGPLSTP